MGVIIPTRNRPSQLKLLLRSIAHLDELPTQVVVVSSGQDVTGIINEFSNELFITHEHMTAAGQIVQKIQAIKLLHKEINWVLTVDDDMQVDANLFRNFKAFIHENRQPKVLGVGLNLNSVNRPKEKSLSHFLGAFFWLSGPPGSVLKNGHPVGYSHLQIEICTQWLNGASIWDRAMLDTYDAEFLHSQYSAYEDVIFSYGASKLGKLKYSPSCKLYFQDQQSEDVSNFEVFHSASYWRFYFVGSNSELSVLGLLWSQIGRSLDFTYRTSGGLGSKVKAFTSSMSIFFDLVFFTIFRTDPLKVLKLRLKRTNN
jgi:glycosyltransferase involved in cell wall biosynthesis